MEYESIYHQLGEALDTQNLESVLSGVPLERQPQALQNYFSEKISEREEYYYSDENPLITGERKIDALMLEVKTQFARAQLEKKDYLIRHFGTVLQKLETAKANITKSHAAFREFIAALKAEIAGVSDSVHLSNLYQRCASLEDEVAELGIAVESAVVVNRAHREQYLSAVADTLQYMQTYLQELNKLNTEGDSLADEINAVLSKSQLGKKMKSLRELS